MVMQPTIITQYKNEEDWMQARLGIPTASRFADACSRLKNGDMSQGCKDYAFELLSERLTGVREDKYVNYSMQWGKEQEEWAIFEMQERLNTKINQTQFYFATKEIAPGCVVGATPDAVSDEFLFEIKCPKTSNHLKNRIDFNQSSLSKYEHQVAGQGMIFDKKVVLVSYDPRLEDESLRLIWVETDIKFVWMTQLIEFCQYVNRLEQEIK
jgi:YqaJ-like recombinase protein